MRIYKYLLVLMCSFAIMPMALAGSTSCSFSKLTGSSGSLYLCNYFPEKKEFFYCTINNTNSTDKISLHAEQNLTISGQKELIDLPVVVVNNVAFEAQVPDASAPAGFVKITFTSEGTNISVDCQSGTGGRNYYIHPNK